MGMAVSERLVEAVTLDVFDVAGLGSVASMERLPGGVANHVYVVNNRYVIRLGTGDDGPSFPRTCAILEALKGRIKAPVPVFTDLSCKRFPWNVMVLTLLEGQPLSEVWDSLNRTEQLTYVHLVGEALQALHRQPWQDIPCCDGPHDPAEQLASHLDDYFRRAYRLGTFSTNRLRRMEEVVGRHRHHLLNAPPPVLIHNDVHFGNVIVKDGALVGLVDIDDAEIARAEIDAWSLLWAVIEESSIPPDLGYQWVNELWPGFLDGNGPRERFLIHAAFNILWDIVTPCTWQSRSEALEAANAHFEDVFEGRVLDLWPL